MSKWRSVLALMLTLTFTSSHAGEVCGRIIKGSKSAKLIPLQGRTLTSVSKDQLLSWGAMLITEHEPIWIEFSDQTQMKVAPGTFFEVSKVETQKHRLYRGSVLVTAPPSIRGFDVFTPNSITEFHGGVMVIRYEPSKRETVIANFNRKVNFKNRFHPEAQTLVNAGELSKLWVGNSNLSPKQPRLLNPESIRVAFEGFEIPKEEIQELVQVVKRVVDSREKSLVADLESWIDMDQQDSLRQNRTVASFSGKAQKDSSIDPKEAEWALNLMKKRLFEDASESLVSEDGRKPASAPSILNDPEYQKKKVQLKEQLKKVYEDIRNFNPESD